MPAVIGGLAAILVSAGIPTAIAGPLATVLTVGAVSRDGRLVQHPNKGKKP